MTSFLTFYLNQDATYWAKTGIDGYGKPAFSVPVTIKCRWEERTQFFINAEGVQQPSKATVFLAQDVVIGDYLFLGTSAGVDPLVVLKAYRVMDFRKIPDLEAIDFERMALL